MKKVIVMVRTSTEAQQVEDQHREMIQFCKEQGYSEEQMVFVETQGASAGKMDDEYLDMIQQVKEHILMDDDVDCFAVWHLNRAVRNEKVYVDLKEFLVKHRIQFLVKNPYLKLLNDDGSINMGMELAFSLMSTLAKQDNEERKAKFARAKKAMWEQGKFIGGRCTKTGYKVNSDGYVVIDEEKAQLVRLIFTLYSTGNYSVRTLYEELKERGYELNYHLINRMLSDRIYIDGPYPQMISRELFDRCEDVRKNNYLGIPKGHKYCFGSGIFKCPKCGNNMIAEGEQYRCWHHNKYAAPPHCENGLTIRVDNMDGLLWFIASREEIKCRIRLTEQSKEEYDSKIEILREKIEATQKKLDYIEEKKARINELYVEGLIDKEEFKNRQNKTVLEAKKYNDTILSYNERIGALLSLLEGNKESEEELKRVVTIYDDVRCEKDLQMMNEIVKKHIKRVTSSPEWFGKERDGRAIRQNAQLITVETVYSGVKKYIYVARKYKGHKFFVYKSDGREVPLFTVRPIVREPLGPLHPRAFKKVKDL